MIEWEQNPPHGFQSMESLAGTAISEPEGLELMQVFHRKSSHYGSLLISIFKSQLTKASPLINVLLKREKWVRKCL